jgi:hypothetical protein
MSEGFFGPLLRATFGWFKSKPEEETEAYDPWLLPEMSEEAIDEAAAKFPSSGVPTLTWSMKRKAGAVVAASGNKRTKAG